MSDAKKTISQIAAKARKAADALALSPEDQRNQALLAGAKALRARASQLQQANQKDMEAGQKAGLSAAMLDRLLLTDARIEDMAKGLEVIAALPDPVGRVLAKWQTPNGLDIERVSTPLGVIGIIYESRPNVAADASALCLKSGNATILRGGSDSFHSTAAIVAALGEAIESAGLPAETVQTLPSTDRALVSAMLEAQGEIDVIVPRGGKGLTGLVMEKSRVPVFAHLEGIVHIFVHEKADIETAIPLIENAKMRRTGICGAAEALLIDKPIAAKILPRLADRLAAAGCEMRGDKTAQSLSDKIIPASDDDWGHEYLDAIIAIKIVDGLDGALAHIDRFGSNHTDAILTEDHAVAESFLNHVDSAIVMHNSSTQFADGGQFGMGAEIGIATGRFHARGPVGTEQLTIFKYKVRGKGQCRP